MRGSKGYTRQFTRKVLAKPQTIEEADYVYAILDPVDNEVKIGRSSGHPVKRLASLQTGNPRLLQLLAYTTHLSEAQAHWRYRRWRVRGEWFTLTQALLKDLGSNWDWLNQELHASLTKTLNPSTGDLPMSNQPSSSSASTTSSAPLKDPRSLLAHHGNFFSKAPLTRLLIEHGLYEAHLPALKSHPHNLQQGTHPVEPEYEPATFKRSHFTLPNSSTPLPCFEVEVSSIPSRGRESLSITEASIRLGEAVEHYVIDCLVEAARSTSESNPETTLKSKNFNGPYHHLQLPDGRTLTFQKTADVIHLLIPEMPTIYHETLSVTVHPQLNPEGIAISSN